MAFNKDTPEVREWMADYANGRISDSTAARLNVGGQGEFGEITEQECEDEYSRIISEQLRQDMENGMIIDVQKLEKGTNLQIEDWPNQTGIRAALERAGIPECMIAQIEDALPTTSDIQITGECTV